MIPFKSHKTGNNTENYLMFYFTGNCQTALIEMLLLHNHMPDHVPTCTININPSI